MKVALIELNYWHDEVLPTFVYALNELGVQPDVYMPRRAARKDAFALTPELRFERFLTDGTSRIQRARIRIRGTPSWSRRYDLVIMNSVEPLEILQAATSIRQPTIAIVHNADLLEEHDAYRRFFAQKSRLPMVLGAHVARAAFSPDSQAWLAPYYLGHPAWVEAEDGRIRLCVQGNVEYSRRHYPSLVDAVVELAAERSDFVVRMVGRSNAPDGLDLRATVRDRGVADFFTFTDGEISHGEYLGLVATSDFVLPLLDSRTPALQPYFRHKLTMSMAMAIGLGVLPVAEATLADLYGVERSAVVYEPGGILQGIRAALAMPRREQQDRLDKLEAVRAGALLASVQNLAGAINRLKPPPT